MASKRVEEAADLGGSGPTQLLQFAEERADRMFDLQKELLAAYDEAGRAWVARVKSEVDLWSDLATKLTGARNVPEGMEAYGACASQRLQLAAEDGQRLFREGQKVIDTVTRSLSQLWPHATPARAPRK